LETSANVIWGGGGIEKEEEKKRKMSRNKEKIQKIKGKLKLKG
jgi:hypothetical protein